MDKAEVVFSLAVVHPAIAQQQPLIFYPRLYRRNDRPSCVLGAVRLLRCGAIISMPRLASAASNESEFVANQAFGFIRHKIIVDSTSLDSCGEALDT